MLFRISKTYRLRMSDAELYEATRGIWVVPGPRKDNAKYAMAVYQGVVREVYRIDKWDPAGATPYPTRCFDEQQKRGRSEFVGGVADEALREKYIGKSVASYFLRGNVGPVGYVNCTS